MDQSTESFFFFFFLIAISLKNTYEKWHYANMPVQYTAIFQGFKNGNFQMKKCDSFLIFAQIIDRGYTLEPTR